MTDVNSVLDAVTTLNWPRAFAAIVLALLVGTGLSVFEVYTHGFRLDRTELALNVAQKAEEYRRSVGPTATAEQHQIYVDAIAQAQDAIHTSFELPRNSQSVKFAFALFPWLLMAFVYLSGSDNGRMIGAFGAVLIGAIVAAGLAYIPNVLWPFGNIVLLPAAAWLTVVGLFSFLSRRKRRVA